MVSPFCTVMAVPPSQFQARLAADVCGAGSYEATARGAAAGRVAGAEALGGGGSGELWIAACRCGTEPVTSFAGAWTLEDDRKIRSDSKRWVSELQLTAATEIDASTARRNNRSERPGSSTRRIGLSHSYATGPRGELTARG